METILYLMCPNCGYTRKRKWEELDREEQMLVAKLPLNTEYSEKERKTHCFCARCWYEFVPKTEAGKERLA